MRKWSKCQ